MSEPVETIPVELRNPDFVFRYRRLDNAIAELDRGGQWFASPYQFNDPLDCKWNPFWQILDPNTREDLLNYIYNIPDDKNVSYGGSPTPDRQNHIEELRAIMSNMNPVQRKHFADTTLNLFTRMHDATYEDNTLNLVREEKMQSARICSTCRNPNSHLMWSHYTANGVGICWIFDKQRFATVTDSIEIAVDYRSAPPEIFTPTELRDTVQRFCAYPTDKIQYMIDKLISVKSKCWEYESEVRFVRRLPENTTPPFFCPWGGSISGMILGIGRKKGNYDSILKLFTEKYPHLPIYITYLSQINFDFEINRLTPPSSPAALPGSRGC